MPGLSGIDILKEIRKLRPNTEVIVITAMELLITLKKPSASALENSSPSLLMLPTSFA